MAAAKPSPRLSIGVPVYNGEAFLRQTLESILAQSFREFELIISDNGSTDGTEPIAREFAARDARVCYHRNATNLGLAKNYNILFSLASGGYFKWASADDLLLPGYLERCIEVLDRDPEVVLVYPRTRFVDAAGKILDIEDPGWNLMSDEPQERLRYVVTSAHWVNSILGVIRASALARTRLLPSYPGGDYCVLGALAHGQVLRDRGATLSTADPPGLLEPAPAGGAVHCGVLEREGRIDPDAAVEPQLRPLPDDRGIRSRRREPRCRSQARSCARCTGGARRSGGRSASRPARGSVATSRSAAARTGTTGTGLQVATPSVRGGRR